MIKKILNYLLVFIIMNIIFPFFNNQYVVAEYVETGYSESGYTTPSSTDNYNPEPSYIGSGGNKLPSNIITGFPAHCSAAGSTCAASAEIIDRRVGVGWDIYDIYDNVYNENTRTEILAGTQVGARLYEERKAWWRGYGTVIITLSCKQLRYAYSYHTCNARGECYDMPVYHWYYYTSSANSWSQECQDVANRMGYNMAKAYVEQGASYSIKMNNPNDARCANIEKYRSQLEQEGKNVNEYCKTFNVNVKKGKTSEFPSNPVVKNYYYEMYGTCINVKTGDVRYLETECKNTNNCCKENEYYVADNNKSEDTKHWHVFIPLNTKETDGFKIVFSPDKTKKEDGKICQSWIDDYSKNYAYTNIIMPLNNEFKRNITVDKKLVQNGCYRITVVDVPFSQKFYNEVKESNTKSEIIGFKFYYRPIDINNPFPNGIADDSYWKLWEDDKKAGKEEPELEKSFNTITYMATDIDLNGIREYNNYNEYPDWTNLNIDGSSNFIKDYNFIERNSIINNNSFYSLGCGSFNQCPYYIDKNGVRKENPIYQPECSKVREGDVCP